MISPAEIMEASVLARMVAEEMLSRLHVVALQPNCILDAGCGGGDCTYFLRKRYPHSRIIAMDNAPPMLEYAHQKHGAIADWLCTDLAHSPLPPHTVDMVVANLLLPWCSSTQVLFAEWQRVLKPNGLLIFSSFGPGTLTELSSEQDLDLPNFIDMHDLGDALLKQGFSSPVMDAEYFTLRYSDKEKLLRELQLMGMVNTSVTDLSIPLSPENRYNLTYEVIYGHAWVSQPQNEFRANSEGKVVIPLNQLRRREF